MRERTLEQATIIEAMAQARRQGVCRRRVNQWM
jgi:hypothetical protein